MSHSSRKTRSCTLDEIARFDNIIDVRTPAEFADDHIPGAINAPVLDNAQRKQIGTIYKQESAFKATRLGAAMVARNLADYLDTLFSDKPKNWRPLIYCWRGGKRSAATTDWFNLIGWRACQLQGGYKSWRRHVIDQLDTLPANLTFIVVAGPTGSGKTRLLQQLDTLGAQVLDLEGIARHRGSLLGALPNQPQPQQRGFETALYDAIRRFNPNQPIFVEAESRRIGHLDLPATLINRMRNSPCVKVEATLDDRIDFLLEDYQHLFAQPTDFKEKLSHLLGLHSRDTIDHWHQLIDQAQSRTLFEQLVSNHYDPAYHRSSHGNYRQLVNAPTFHYRPNLDDQQSQAQDLLAQLHLSTTENAS